MEWEQFERRGMHELQYGTATRKAITIGKPLIAMAAVIGGVVGAAALIKKLRR